MNTIASFSWISIGTALANHVWQSTLFAVAAAALILLLRHNQARVRYWVWLAASLKFLLPFSLLVFLGAHLHWSESTVPRQASFSFVMEEMSQPFAPASAPQSPAATHSNAYVLSMRLLPACLLVVWLAGFISILLFWYLRWRRMRQAIGGAALLESGRAVDALRRLERKSGIARPTALVATKSSLEPGIIGILHPVMFVPIGIPDRLSDSELAAIVAHELCHIRRRDNLASAVHMLVEALFWFHPIVFWIGARMLAERERACDEEVVALGAEPQAYAEGILKVCEFYLETPLACVAGVTGSNLKKRIEAIMIHRIARKLELGKKLLLASVAAAALILPVVFGLLHPAQSLAEPAQATGATTSGFESVIIQPNTTGKAMPPFNIVAGPNGNFVGFKFSDSQFLATHATLPQIIRMAYGVLDFQITGGPGWLNEAKYDVNAKFLNGMDDQKFWSLPQDEQTRRRDQRTLQLQALLADRFKLVVHRESRQLPIYSLSIAVNGPKLHDASPGDSYANGMKRRDGVPMGAGLWVPQQGVLLGQGVSTRMLAAHLSRQLRRVILDNSGLTGKYDFKLQWAPGEDESTALLAALPGQLGLRLNPQTGPVEMIVIDRADPVQAVTSSAGLLKSVSAQAESQPGDTSNLQSVSITPKGTPDPSALYRSRVLLNPGNAEFENVTLKGFLKVAYRVDDSQVSGGPAWVGAELYDMTVKTATPLKGDALRVEIQKALTDRFKLAMHRELKSLPVDELTVGSGGPKLSEARSDDAESGIKESGMKVENGRIVANGVKLKDLIDYLQLRTGCPVVDKTGLNGVYDFTVTSDDLQQLRKLGSKNGNTALFRALSEQLGLEMKPQTEPVEVLVIDHAEPVADGKKDLAQIH